MIAPSIHPSITAPWRAVRPKLSKSCTWPIRQNSFSFSALKKNKNFISTEKFKFINVAHMTRVLKLTFNSFLSGRLIKQTRMTILTLAPWSSRYESMRELKVFTQTMWRDYIPENRVPPSMASWLATSVFNSGRSSCRIACNDGIECEYMWQRLLDTMSVCILLW